MAEAWECQAGCVASCKASPVMPGRVCEQVCREHCNSSAGQKTPLAWESGQERSAGDSGTYLNSFAANEGCIGYGAEQCYKRCRLVNKESIPVCKCACCSCSFGK